MDEYNEYKINTTLEDDEGICVDCGAVFSKSGKTYGLVLCEKCTADHIANSGALCKCCDVPLDENRSKRGWRLCSCCQDEAERMLNE